MSKAFEKKHSFFTDGQEQEKATPQTERKPRTAPEGYKLAPEYVETKTKRVQLVFQPSIYERAKAAATEQGLSLNEYLHRLIDDATR